MNGKSLVGKKYNQLFSGKARIAGGLIDYRLIFCNSGKLGSFRLRPPICWAGSWLKSIAYVALVGAKIEKKWILLQGLSVEVVYRLVRFLGIVVWRFWGFYVYSWVRLSKILVDWLYTLWYGTFQGLALKGRLALIGKNFYHVRSPEQLASRIFRPDLAAKGFYNHCYDSGVLPLIYYSMKDPFCSRFKMTGTGYGVSGEWFADVGPWMRRGISFRPWSRITASSILYRWLFYVRGWPERYALTWYGGINGQIDRGGCSKMVVDYEVFKWQYQNLVGFKEHWGWEEGIEEGVDDGAGEGTSETIVDVGGEERTQKNYGEGMGLAFARIYFLEGCRAWRDMYSNVFPHTTYYLRQLLPARRIFLRKKAKLAKRLAWVRLFFLEKLAEVGYVVFAWPFGLNFFHYVQSRRRQIYWLSRWDVSGLAFMGRYAPTTVGFWRVGESELQYQFCEYVGIGELVLWPLLRQYTLIKLQSRPLFQLLKTSTHWRWFQMWGDPGLIYLIKANVKLMDKIIVGGGGTKWKIYFGKSYPFGTGRVLIRYRSYLFWGLFTWLQSSSFHLAFGEDPFRHSKVLAVTRGGFRKSPSYNSINTWLALGILLGYSSVQPWLFRVGDPESLDLAFIARRLPCWRRLFTVKMAWTGFGPKGLLLLWPKFFKWDCGGPELGTYSPSAYVVPVVAEKRNFTCFLRVFLDSVGDNFYSNWVFSSGYEWVRWVTSLFAYGWWWFLCTFAQKSQSVLVVPLLSHILLRKRDLPLGNYRGYFYGGRGLVEAIGDYFYTFYNYFPYQCVNYGLLYPFEGHGPHRRRGLPVSAMDTVRQFGPYVVMFCKRWWLLHKLKPIKLGVIPPLQHFLRRAFRYNSSYSFYHFFGLGGFTNHCLSAWSLEYGVRPVIYRQELERYGRLPFFGEGVGIFTWDLDMPGKGWKPTEFTVFVLQPGDLLGGVARSLSFPSIFLWLRRLLFSDFVVGKLLPLENRKVVPWNRPDFFLNWFWDELHRFLYMYYQTSAYSEIVLRRPQRFWWYDWHKYNYFISEAWAKFVAVKLLNIIGRIVDKEVVQRFGFQLYTITWYWFTASAYEILFLVMYHDLCYFIGVLQNYIGYLYNFSLLDGVSKPSDILQAHGLGAAVSFSAIVQFFGSLCGNGIVAYQPTVWLVTQGKVKVGQRKILNIFASLRFDIVSTAVKLDGLDTINRPSALTRAEPYLSSMHFVATLKAPPSGSRGAYLTYVQSTYLGFYHRKMLRGLEMEYHGSPNTSRLFTLYYFGNWHFLGFKVLFKDAPNNRHTTGRRAIVERLGALVIDHWLHRGTVSVGFCLTWGIGLTVSVLSSLEVALNAYVTTWHVTGPGSVLGRRHEYASFIDFHGHGYRVHLGELRMYGLHVYADGFLMTLFFKLGWLDHKGVWEEFLTFNYAPCEELGWYYHFLMTFICWFSKRLMAGWVVSYAFMKNFFFQAPYLEGKVWFLPELFLALKDSGLNAYILDDVVLGNGHITPIEATVIRRLMNAAEWKDYLWQAKGAKVFQGFQVPGFDSGFYLTNLEQLDTKPRTAVPLFMVWLDKQLNFSKIYTKKAYWSFKRGEHLHHEGTRGAWQTPLLEGDVPGAYYLNWSSLMSDFGGKILNSKLPGVTFLVSAAGYKPPELTVTFLYIYEAVNLLHWSFGVFWEILGIGLGYDFFSPLRVVQSDEEWWSSSIVWSLTEVFSGMLGLQVVRAQIIGLYVGTSINLLTCVLAAYPNSLSLYKRDFTFSSLGTFLPRYYGLVEPEYWTFWHVFFPLMALLEWAGLGSGMFVYGDTFDSWTELAEEENLSTGLTLNVLRYCQYGDRWHGPYYRYIEYFPPGAPEEDIPAQYLWKVGHIFGEAYLSSYDTKLDGGNVVDEFSYRSDVYQEVTYYWFGALGLAVTGANFITNFTFLMDPGGLHYWTGASVQSLFRPGDTGLQGKRQGSYASYFWLWVSAFLGDFDEVKFTRVAVKHTKWAVVWRWGAHYYQYGNFRMSPYKFLVDQGNAHWVKDGGETIDLVWRGLPKFVSDYWRKLWVFRAQNSRPFSRKETPLFLWRRFGLVGRLVYSLLEDFPDSAKYFTNSSIFYHIVRYLLHLGGLHGTSHLWQAQDSQLQGFPRFDEHVELYFNLRARGGKAVYKYSAIFAFVLSNTLTYITSAYKASVDSVTLCAAGLTLHSVPRGAVYVRRVTNKHVGRRLEAQVTERPSNFLQWQLDLIIAHTIYIDKILYHFFFIYVFGFRWWTQIWQNERMVVIFSLSQFIAGLSEFPSDRLCEKPVERWTAYKPPFRPESEGLDSGELLWPHPIDWTGPSRVTLGGGGLFEEHECADTQRRLMREARKKWRLARERRRKWGFRGRKDGKLVKIRKGGINERAPKPKWFDFVLAYFTRKGKFIGGTVFWAKWLGKRSSGDFATFLIYSEIGLLFCDFHGFVYYGEVLMWLTYIDVMAQEEDSLSMYWVSCPYELTSDFRGADLFHVVSTEITSLRLWHYLFVLQMFRRLRRRKKKLGWYYGIVW